MTGTSESPALSGRHALVTGGGRGIGAAIAEALSAAGATVSLLGRARGPLEETLSRLPVQGGVAVADVTDPGQVRTAVDAVRRVHGGVDIVVNNAGMAESAPFERTSAEMWARTIAVNLDGAFHVTQAVLDDLLAAEHGRIVNVASTAALRGYAYVTAYCAAKHGLLGLTRALAAELARTTVTVNAVCPGYVETDMLTRSLDRISKTTSLDVDAARERLAAQSPQNRFITTDEVAHSVLWLVSPAARGVTGQAIAIAGGEVM